MSNVKIYLKPEDEVNTSFTPTVDKKPIYHSGINFFLLCVLPIFKKCTFVLIQRCTLNQLFLSKIQSS